MNYNLSLGFYTVVEQAEDYALMTPDEVCNLSKTGLIVGYELLRWGEAFHEQGGDAGFMAAVANKYAVGAAFLDDNDKSFVKGSGVGDDWKLRRRREGYVTARRFRPWSMLHRFDRDYLMSLLWLPEVPLSPLEALGRMANEPERSC